MEERTDTVGKLATDLLKNPDTKQSVVDTQREADKEYFKEIEKCVQTEPHKNWIDPWYIVIIHKKERLLQNVVRRYFFGRQSLPTPDLDQTVWRYYPSSGNLEFLWCIPDKTAVREIAANKNLIVPEQHQLTKFVLEFINGTLYSSFLKKYPE